MNLKLALASTLFIALATGCGGSDDDTGFTGGKICPQSMIDARNEVSYDCAAAASPSVFETESEKRSNMISCRNSIQSFLDRNPNVYCQATNLSQGTQTYVDSDELKRILREIEAEL